MPPSRSSLPRTAFLAAVSVALAAAIPTSALAAPLRATSTISVDAETAPRKATIAGDFNGDGKDDLVVSSHGKVQVVFGASSYSPVDLAAGGPRVRTISGVAGFAVDAAGDFDGDGYDDFITVADGASSASVVYGGPVGGGSTASPTPGNGLTTINTGPLAIPRIEGAGDFNGDGFDDVVVAWNAQSANQAAAAIVLGGPRVATLAAGAQSSRVSLLRGPKSCWYVNLIFQVCTTNRVDALPVGDFNGDGKDDLFVATTGTRSLLLGRAAPFTLTANALGSTGTVNLSARLTGVVNPAAFTSQARGLFGVGDVDGDGKDDLAIAVRAQTADTPYQAILKGRANPAATIPATEPVLELAYDGALAIVNGAGDQNGDGRADLLVAGAALKVLTDVPSASQPGHIAALPALAETPRALGYQPRVGDLDGDGQTDLLGATVNQLVPVTHGDDHYAPELSRIYTQLESASFPATAGTKLTIVASTAAEVELAITRSEAPVTTETRAVAQDDTTAYAWLPKAAGQPLPAGEDYVLTLTPVDAAGNRGPSLTRPFAVTDAPNAAIVDHKTTVYGPGGAYAGGLNVTQRWMCPGEGGRNGNGVDLLRLEATAGDPCSLSATFTGFGGTMPPEYAQCTWKVSLMFNGVPQPDGLAPVTLVAGSNTLIQRYDCETPTTGGGQPPASVTDPGWRRVGSAGQPAGAGVLRLTLPQANQTGSAFWPQAVDWRERTVEFTAAMSGGNGAAEGLTLAFLPAGSSAYPAAGFLGAGAGKLGFGGLTGTAIALDVFKQDTDPSSNFVGIAQATTATSLNYLSWADPGVRLRSGVITVKVVSKAGQVTVFVNGKQRLTRALTLPSSGYVGFTASTGPSVYQQTDIRSISVTAS